MVAWGPKLGGFLSRPNRRSHCLAAGVQTLGAEQEWRGLVVVREHRCTPYDSRDYPYLQSVEYRSSPRSAVRSTALTPAAIIPAGDRPILSTSSRGPKDTTADFVEQGLTRRELLLATC